MMTVSRVRLDSIVKQWQIVYITWHLIHLYNLKMWYWVSGNKEQLIQLVFNGLLDPVLLQINGHISCWENLRTTLEEADTILIHHLVGSFLYCWCILHSLVTLNHRYTYMQSTGKESSVLITYITATYQGHTNITPNILAGHGLSGCGKVCSYFGIGKKTVINVLNKKSIDLSSIEFVHETSCELFEARN